MAVTSLIRARSKAEVAQTRVIVRPAAERPAELALGLRDRVFVDAGMARAHQPVLGEFPVLVAIGTKPLAAVVVVFVGIADGDAVALESPKLLDQAIIELAVPFARQESLSLGTVGREFGAIAPARVDRIGERDLGGIAAVPAIFGKANLLDGGLFIEGGSGGRDIDKLLVCVTLKGWKGGRWSCGKAIDTWEIDLGAQSFVDVVGEGVQRDMRDDLENFRIAIAGRADLFDFAGCSPSRESRQGRERIRQRRRPLDHSRCRARFASISLSSSLANFVPV